jgi:hypothetical protein
VTAAPAPAAAFLPATALPRLPFALGFALPPDAVGDVCSSMVLSPNGNGGALRLRQLQRADWLRTWGRPPTTRP